MEKEPKEPEKYLHYEVDGIHIYINPNIAFSRKDVKMDIRRYLFTHEIFIDGVDIAY